MAKQFRKIVVVIAFVLCAIAALAQILSGVNPWANSSWQPPPGYTGQVFKLSYNYPTEPPKIDSDPPWIKALQGKPISAENAIAYVQAVKDYIGPDMRTLILDYAHWNAEERGWYNLPWLFALRDPIHGTFAGTQFDPTSFPLSNMRKNVMTDYVLVYYNNVAGYTLGQIWDKTATAPNLKDAQFKEGAIIIKLALTDATANYWSPMEGAQTWDLFPPVPNPNGPPIPDAPKKVVKAAFFQFDIIVKDTKTSPNTGWVFATLVYDKSVPGDAWDRMVPMGAMWGNDPNLNSVVTPNAALQESVVNPLAPLYSVETLGWGGRLSGPNDEAVSENNIANGQLLPRASISSCMSCHGTAEWPIKTPPVPALSLSNIHAPGSPPWSDWFQDRPGNVPQNAGATALDYDMNMTFKALPLWQYYSNLSPAARLASLSELPKHVQEILLSPADTTQSGRRFREPE